MDSRDNMDNRATGTTGITRTTGQQGQPGNRKKNDNSDNNDIRDNENNRATETTRTTRTLNRSSGKAVQLLANFFSVLTDNPRSFCESYKCNSIQFPSCFYSGECRRELKFRAHS